MPSSDSIWIIEERRRGTEQAEWVPDFNANFHSKRTAQQLADSRNKNWPKYEHRVVEYRRVEP